MLRPTGVFTVVSIVPFLLLIVQIILFLTQIRVSQRYIRLKSRDCILVRSMSCLYADKPREAESSHLQSPPSWSENGGGFYTPE